jgi:hypothetical protein
MATTIKWLIISSAGVFIVILMIAAVFDPSIRVLHVFEALIYIVVIIGATKESPSMYGAGCFMASFWNWTNLAHTTFIANGFRELRRLVETGTIRRPDQFIAIIAAAAHFILIAGCIAGLIKLKPRNSLVFGKFLVGGIATILYFVAIIVIFGPQYIPLMKEVFGI